MDSYGYTGQSELQSNTRESSRCYRSDDSESTRNIRETVVSSVLCILDIFRNIIPPETKESMLSRQLPDVDSTETVNLDLKTQPRQKDLVEQHNYKKLKKTFEKPFRIKECQSSVPKEKLKEKKIRSSKDNCSILGLNERLPERNLNFSKQREKVAMECNLYETSEFRTPKRLHGKNRKIGTNCGPINQADILKSLGSIAKVKKVIEVLLQPSTKREKIQRVQMLKKDKSLMTLFLKERKKLGKIMIPIKIHKGRKLVTSPNVHQNTEVSNRDIASYKRSDIVDTKSRFPQEGGDNFTFKLQNCQFEENLQKEIELPSHTARCRGDRSEGTFNPVQISMENYNSESACDIGNLSVDYNRYNENYHKSEQTKLSTRPEGEKTPTSTLMANQEASRKPSMHPETLYPEPAWDNLFTQTGPPALSHRESEIQSLLVENTADRSLNGYLVDKTGSENTKRDNINVENFENNCIENLTQNFENSQMPQFQPTAVKNSPQNILFSPLQQHFQYLAYGNEIVEYT